MAGKRRWRQWPGRAAGELNGVSGVAGVGGIVLGAGGYGLGLAGTAALFTGIGGAVIVVGAVGYALFRAIPPLTRRPEDLIGQTIKIAELRNISQPIQTLSIIGMTESGKTTLKNRLLLDPAPVERTQRITASIMSPQTAPPTYIAILDGGGDRFPQQFPIAESCDCLCILLDHNKSNSALEISPGRVAEQEAFLKQIRYQLDEINSRPKLWIHFLVNKRDLWEHAAAEQKATFEHFYNGELEKWQQGNRAATVTIKPHSNDNANDVAKFMENLRDQLTTNAREKHNPCQNM
jgi:hypothetical protein